MNDRCDVVYVSVEADGEERLLTAPAGATLRDVLLDAGQSPYTRLTERLNCGGRGLCATCGVRIEGDVPEPTHWHDGLASRWGYPRLSCRIRLESDLRVRIPEKVIWGRRTGADGLP
ncbi:2Fe-2S iron-sulfur cluster-binding protein [Haloplanus litoreus]|uniref:2Fe-2S iron-sulfur cluster-binding protein n=1 Tax=Haloplanus litoreus TaxID=767515 RepID=A0ABD5ZWJ1_9EURY